jgi:hypothetical protein
MTAPVNFKGRKGPGQSVVLHRHHSSGGKAKARSMASLKRKPIVAPVLNWKAPMT